jgi:hypothetical protein
MRSLILVFAVTIVQQGVGTLQPHCCQLCQVTECENYRS